MVKSQLLAGLLEHLLLVRAARDQPVHLEAITVNNCYNCNIQATNNTGGDHSSYGVCTFTSRRCPMRWQRACAWMSFCGFQSESWMITVSAAARLIPN